jgi:hypothetical protein
MINMSSASSPSLVKKVLYVRGKWEEEMSSRTVHHTSNGAGGVIQRKSVQLNINVDSKRISVRGTSDCADDKLPV